MIEPTVMPQEGLGRIAAEEIGQHITTYDSDISGTCCAAVAHPAGLLYTAHQHWDNENCRFIVHVWDLRPRAPERLHSFFPTDRAGAGMFCCMHLDGGFLGMACQLAGRPQIRHALRPAGKPGMVLQSKLDGGLHIDEDDRSASAIHVRSSKRDVLIGYNSGKVSYHDLESGICFNDVHGLGTSVTALSSYGDQVFACGRGHDNHAFATMLSTRSSELFGTRLLPWGALMEPPDHEACKLLSFNGIDAVVKALVETTVQANALLVDGQRLLVAANDVIFVWDGLTEPQDARLTLAHTLQLQHFLHGEGRAVGGAVHLAVASEREQMFVAINGKTVESHGAVLSTCECTVQVWSLPRSDSRRAPACLHTLPAECGGSITAMVLVDTRLLTWGTDRTMTVWPIFPNEATSAEVAAAAPLPPGPAPWEVGGGAQHPSVEDGGGMLDGEEPWEMEPDDSDDESAGSVSAGEDEDEDEDEDEAVEGA